MIDMFNPKSKRTQKFFKQLNDSVSDREARKIDIDAKLHRGFFK